MKEGKYAIRVLHAVHCAKCIQTQNGSAPTPCTIISSPPHFAPLSAFSFSSGFRQPHITSSSRTRLSLFYRLTPLRLAVFLRCWFIFVAFIPPYHLLWTSCGLETIPVAFSSWAADVGILMTTAEMAEAPEIA